MAIPNLSATAETFMATVILIRGGRVMKKLFYFAAFAACLLTSCQQALDIQEKEEDIKTPGLVFTATTESSATKTALEEDSGNYNVAWRSGDEITIIDAAATPNVGVYSTSSNTTSADFTFASGAEASTAPFKAWYPASIYNNGAPTLPATQEYVEGNIAGSPMFASSSTTSLKFKNLAGIICLNLSTGMADISVASIALSATQPMSGPISNAESLSSETPVAATVSGSAGVTLNCGTGVAINGTPKPFYFAVPAGTYSGLSITVTATTGAYQTFTLKADKTIVVERSQITDINLTANNILASLANLKDLVNAGKDASAYLGRYVYADGSIGTDATGAIGLVAYTSKTSEVVTSINEECRILVLRNEDIDAQRYGDDAGWAKHTVSTLGKAIADVSWTNWLIPSHSQWDAIIGSDGLGAGDYAALCGDSSLAKLNAERVYWSSTGTYRESGYNWWWIMDVIQNGAWSTRRDDSNYCYTRAVFGF